ncbi:MAG: C2H2-type zinc finger protein [Sedimenticola sp.]
MSFQFECRHCYKRFRDAGSLRRHIRDSHGAKMLCGEVGCRFTCPESRPYMMTQHRLEAHRIPGTCLGGRRTRNPRHNPYTIRIPAPTSPGFVIPHPPSIQAYTTSSSSDSLQQIITQDRNTEHISSFFSNIPALHSDFTSKIDTIASNTSVPPADNSEPLHTFTDQQQSDLLRELDFLDQDLGPDPAVELVDPSCLLVSHPYTHSPGQTSSPIRGADPTLSFLKTSDAPDQTVAAIPETSPSPAATLLPTLPDLDCVAPVYSEDIIDIPVSPAVSATENLLSIATPTLGSLRLDLQPQMIELILTLAQQLRSSSLTTKATQTDSVATKDSETQVQYVLHSSGEE